MKRLLCVLWILLLSFPSQAQHEHHHGADRAIEFPDVPAYQVLKADLHQHTVFSDGRVWPSIRVQEALKDELDAIAMTDHLEYQPHSKDIPHPNRNRAYQVARQAADEHELLVINGSEITREMPPGHANAIFLKDANPLLKDDPMAVFKEAHSQVVAIQNRSDARYVLDSQNEVSFHAHSDVVHLTPQDTTRLQVKPGERVNSIQLTFEVLNVVTAPEEHPSIPIDVTVSE
ncbi:MAG: Sb-PDE family phosphodiesterase [Salinibacter sp.]|uniref:Sb-PDE family phosphodiesterase n=1 Tax=Salinibacter sp. TaxID=2065818 RepID=UPI0035D4DDAE